MMSLFTAGDGRDLFFVWDPDWRNAHDTIRFGEGIDHRDLWVSYNTDEDLVFDIVGTDQQLAVENWQRGVWARPEVIETASGYTLSESGIQQLVSVMAQFSNGAPSAGVLEDPAVQAQVSQAIAAAWQPKEAAA